MTRMGHLIFVLAGIACGLAHVTSSTAQTAATTQELLDAFFKQTQSPIEFYGKTVDEAGRPLPGVNVRMSWNQIAAQKSWDTNLISGTDGLFQLRGVTGSGMSVRVSKPGYYAVTRSNQMGFSYTALPGEHPFVSDPANPVVFHLKKKGLGTELITSAYGVKPHLGVQAPLDGTPVKVDLLERKVGQTGQMVISQNQPAYSRLKEAQEWSFKMEIPDGGFVEHNDEFPFEAPEAGYQREITFRFVKGQPNWSPFVKKRYYIAFGQPRRYGWLTLDTEMAMAGARFEYAINPDGSRYLEGKEYKEPERVLPPGVTEIRP